MAITKIEVENFTVFNKMAMEIDANVNVLIGENGTGKTQLLKFVYATAQIRSGRDNPRFRDYFGMKEGLIVRDKERGKASIKVTYDQIPLQYYVQVVKKKDVKEIFHGLDHDRDLIFFRPIGEYDTEIWSELCIFERFKETKKEMKELVFIPAKDMLTHSPNFLSLVRERKMPFDETLVDIISKAGLSELKKIPELAINIMPKLELAMDGTVIFENDEFFILKNDGQKVSFNVEAEGMKKIGLIWRLLMNGSITKDTILLWDEPEANINPKLIPVLAEIILELGRNGVQVFLATHDYFLPKYIEVLSLDTDKLAFHALYKTDNGVQCETANQFAHIEKNAIRDEMIALYEKEVEKVMG